MAIQCLACGNLLPGNPPQCPWCGSLGPAIEVDAPGEQPTIIDQTAPTVELRGFAGDGWSNANPGESR